MADYFTKASFAFTCSARETALIEEAFQLADDLQAGLDSAAPSPEFLAIFPSVNADPFAGFRAIFADSEFPEFGAELETASQPHDAATCTVRIFSMGDFQPEPIAALIHRTCAPSLREAPVGFEWAMTCSRARLDGFGGGWCAIFADRIEFGSTGQSLATAIAGGID